MLPEPIPNISQLHIEEERDPRLALESFGRQQIHFLRRQIKCQGFGILLRLILVPSSSERYGTLLNDPIERHRGGGYIVLLREGAELFDEGLDVLEGVLPAESASSVTGAPRRRRGRTFDYWGPGSPC